MTEGAGTTAAAFDIPPEERPIRRIAWLLWRDKLALGAAAYLVVLPEDAAAGQLIPFYEARGFVEKGRRLLFFDGDLSVSGAGG